MPQQRDGGQSKPGMFAGGSEGQWGSTEACRMDVAGGQMGARGQGGRVARDPRGASDSPWSTSLCVCPAAPASPTQPEHFLGSRTPGSCVDLPSSPKSSALGVGRPGQVPVRADPDAEEEEV